MCVVSLTWISRHSVVLCCVFPASGPRRCPGESAPPAQRDGPHTAAGWVPCCPHKLAPFFWASNLSADPSAFLLIRKGWFIKSSCRRCLCLAWLNQLCIAYVNNVFYVLFAGHPNMGGPMQRMTPPRGMVPLGPQVFSTDGLFLVTGLDLVYILCLCIAWRCPGLVFIISF